MNYVKFNGLNFIAMNLLQKTTLFCGLALAIAATGCAQTVPSQTDAPTAQETAIEADTVQADTAQDNAEAVAANTETVEGDTASNPPQQSIVQAASNSVQPSSIQITDSSIGSITPSTPFSVEAIQAAFPTMTVRTETQMAEGMEYPVIVASDNSGRAMEVESTVDSKIYRVTTMSPQFSGASGHTVGDSFSSIYDSVIPRDCFPGVEAAADMVSCPAPGTQSVRYVFAGNWGPLMGQLPPDAELSNSTMKMIFWGSGNY